MKLLTVQHRIVLETLQNNGRYYCNFISEYQKTTPQCYKRLAEQLAEKTGISVATPVFCFSNVIGLPLKANKKTFYRIDGMIGIPEDKVILELSVPEKIALHTDFYDFADVKYEEEYEEGIELVDYIMTDYRFNERYGEWRECQTLIPYIDPQFLVATHTYQRP